MTENVITGLLGKQILLDVQDIDREAVFSRLNTLNMAHHMASSFGNDIGMLLRKGDPVTFVTALESAIDTTTAFHSFLDENRIAMEEVKSNIKALVFGRISDVVSMYEEYSTQEDPLKDVLLQLIPFGLSMLSEKSYISSAEIGQKGVLRSHALVLYSDVYDFIKATRTPKTLKEAEEIADMMSQLYIALDSAVGDEHGLLLFTGLYLAMYNLRTGELLNMVNHEHQSMKSEV